MSRPADSRSLFQSPLWASSFRPFYLLGTAYGLVLILLWSGAYGGLWELAGRLHFWHGHEMIFGFAGAIIIGIVFTALPSWAGTPEMRGATLALLVALWLVGRVAYWLAPWLPAGLVGGTDCALFLVAALIVTPGLLRIPDKLYLLLPPILLGLFAGNALYHAGIAAADADLAWRGLLLAIYAIVVLYVLKGGVLTPIFTGNLLREKGRGDQVSFRYGLEVLGVVSVLALAAADLLGLSAPAVGGAALTAGAIHAYRAWRWQGWRTADTPLVFSMHVGFLWLIAAFVLKAVSAFQPALPQSVWVHAFTVGGLGMMMLGLMTRVVLRHTGRRLAPPRVMNAAYGMMFAAALLRVAGTLAEPIVPALLASAFLWAAAFAVYLALFGAMLWRPSLPRRGAP